MYNKLFTKILDSSVWLAPDPHRLVWITLIAAMDQDSFCAFACTQNLAARARVSIEQTEQAVIAFEGPDPFGPDQEYEGRRIERVQGGWFILNGQKYRTTVTRAIQSEQSRLRMQRFRDKQRNEPQRLRNVTSRLRSVTPSVSVSVSDQSKEIKRAKRCPQDFEITPELAAWALEHCPKVDPVAELAKLKDWEFKTARRDWPAVFRNWLREAHARLPAVANGEALEAWQTLVKSGGERPDRTDQVQNAIDACGGWTAIRMRTQYDENRIKTAFCAAYDAHGRS